MRLVYRSLFLLLAALTSCQNLLPPPTPTLSPQVMQGKAVFDKYCSRCHSTIKDEIIVGPSLAGVATRGATRIPGMDAEAYIRNSIQKPTAYTVNGFTEGLMPSTLIDELSPEEFEAVVAFLLTQK